MAHEEQRLMRQVIQHIIDWYRPGAIVLQMGADSLAGDKLGGFNLTLDGKLWISHESENEANIPRSRRVRSIRQVIQYPNDDARRWWIYDVSCITFKSLACS